MRRSRLAVASALLLGACLGEQAGTGAARRVAVDPDVVNFSRRGDALILAGRVYQGNVLAADSAGFAWHAVDSTVASVTPDGVVTARGDGVTRVWGVSGGDSAFTVIVVQTPAAPTAVTLTPGRLQFSALTAGAILAAHSTDTLAADSAAVCRSDDPAVAVVEGLTVQAKGEGTTRVRCAIMGVEGTATVIVRQRIERVRVVSDQALAMRVGRDTLVVALARVDSLRQPVARGVPRFVSLDTGTVQVDPVSGTVVALALGKGRIVGTIEGFADTAEIRVVEALPPTVSPVIVRRGGAAGGTARRPGVRTAGRTGAASRAGASSMQLGVRDFRDQDSIFQAGDLLVSARPPRWAPSLVIIPLAERRNDIGPDDNTPALGRSTGPLFGVEVEATPGAHLRFRLSGVGGKMSAKVSNTMVAGETATVVEAKGDVGYAVFPWLWLQLGGGRRTFATQAPSTLAHWTSLRTGAEARFGLGKGAMQGLVRLSWLPLVVIQPTVNGHPAAFGAEAGVDFRTGKLAAGIHYALDRFDFPAAASERREQFATLRLRLGLELGR